MVYEETELKGKTVKDLKEIARELGVSAGGRKDELVAAILTAQVSAAAADLEEGLEDGLDDDLDIAGSAEAAHGNASAAAEAAAAGKHATIVFALQSQQAVEKKANLVGIKALSDAERAQLRAAKFGLAAKASASKPAAGAKPTAGAGISNVGGVGVGVEEEIKKLLRAQKFSKLSDKDEAKLSKLQKQLEAQKQKQQLALDKAEITDPEKMKQREARFGFNLNKSAAKDPKDPELMKKRAAKFGVNKPGISVSSADDEARKKARLARFAKQ